MRPVVVHQSGVAGLKNFSVFVMLNGFSFVH